MTPRLWKDVLELQKQAKLKYSVIFSAQGTPKKVGALLAGNMTISLNFASFLSSNTSSLNLGVMWRRNQKRTSGGLLRNLLTPSCLKFISGMGGVCKRLCPGWMAQVILGTNWVFEAHLDCVEVVGGLGTGLDNI